MCQLILVQDFFRIVPYVLATNRIFFTIALYPPSRPNAYENLPGTEKIDENIACTPQLYGYCNRKLYENLDEMQTGTRLATYHSFEDHIPPGYQLEETTVDSLLKFWIKI